MLKLRVRLIQFKARVSTYNQAYYIQKIKDAKGTRLDIGDAFRSALRASKNAELNIPFDSAGLAIERTINLEMNQKNILNAKNREINGSETTEKIDTIDVFNICMMELEKFSGFKELMVFVRRHAELVAPRQDSHEILAEILKRNKGTKVFESSSFLLAGIPNLNSKLISLQCNMISKDYKTAFAAHSDIMSSISKMEKELKQNQCKILSKCKSRPNITSDESDHKSDVLHAVKYKSFKNVEEGNSDDASKSELSIQISNDSAFEPLLISKEYLFNSRHVSDKIMVEFYSENYLPHRAIQIYNQNPTPLLLVLILRMWCGSGQFLIALEFLRKQINEGMKVDGDMVYELYLGYIKVKPLKVGVYKNLDLDVFGIAEISQADVWNATVRAHASRGEVMRAERAFVQLVINRMKVHSKAKEALMGMYMKQGWSDKNKAIEHLERDREDLYNFEGNEAVFPDMKIRDIACMDFN